MSARPAARRTVALTGCATLLATAGLTALLSAASAEGCAVFSDPKDDAGAMAPATVMGVTPTVPDNDPNLDIVSTEITTVGPELVATIKVVNLIGAPNNHFSDRFSFGFTLHGKVFSAFNVRHELPGAGDALKPAFLQNGVTVDGTTTVDLVKFVYDEKADTVRLAVKTADLDKLAGKPSAGAPLTLLTSRSAAVIVGPNVAYDTSAAPMGTTYVGGSACGGDGGAVPAPAPSGEASGTPSAAPSGSAAPSASATPSSSASPSASASPTGSASPAPSGSPAAGAAGLPQAGCFTFADPKGDAASTGGTAEPDLDFLGMTLQSTPEATKVFLKVDKLAARPAQAAGHSFYAFFTVGGKLVRLGTTAYDPAALSTPEDTLAGATAALPAGTAPPTQLRVAGTYVPSTLKATFDRPNSTVILAIPTSELTKATAGAFVPGAALTAVSARNATSFPVTGGFFVDSTAKDNAAAATPAETWAVGDNACFSTPTTLTSVGAVTAQFGDVAKVAVKLVDGAGAPVAGQPVAVSVAGTTATVKTGADGIARLAATMRGTAGASTLVATFAGEGALGSSTLSARFTTTVEKTVLSVKGGAGTVTATLLDDDKKPVAVQAVTFTQGSLKKTVKTGANGVAKASGFTTGTTVAVSYAGLAGKYTAVKGSARA